MEGPNAAPTYIINDTSFSNITRHKRLNNEDFKRKQNIFTASNTAGVYFGGTNI